MMKNKERLAQTLVFFSMPFILGSFGEDADAETSYLLIHEGKDSLDRVENWGKEKKVDNPLQKLTKCYII